MYQFRVWGGREGVEVKVTHMYMYMCVWTCIDISHVYIACVLTTSLYTCTLCMLYTCKSLLAPQIKKLVYVYLVRYAEEQQDVALLSISTFQKALKDPNQLIRASALRVLSSIRVPIIAPIMMLAIKDVSQWWYMCMCMYMYMYVHVHVLVFITRVYIHYTCVLSDEKLPKSPW